MEGTTEAITIPWMDLGSTSAAAKRFRNSTPYSSTVCVQLVATRQWATRRSYFAASPFALSLRANTPSTVLVLPTSRSRSMSMHRSAGILPAVRNSRRGGGATLFQRPYPAGKHRAQSVARFHLQETARIQAGGHTLVASIFLHAYAAALGIGRTLLEASQHRFTATGPGLQQSAVFAV